MMSSTNRTCILSFFLVLTVSLLFASFTFFGFMISPFLYQQPITAVSSSGTSNTFLPEIGKADTIRKVAVIYAYPTFHDEVVASVVCVLKDLGFHTVVYINNGVQIRGYLLPFSSQRQKNSNEFYGGCVSEWVTVMQPRQPPSSPDTISRMSMSEWLWEKFLEVTSLPEADVRYVSNPALMVFVTFPMLLHGFRKDTYALALLERLRMEKATTPVVFITHRSNEMIGDGMEAVQSIIPRNQTFYTFLGEHTFQTACDIIGREKNECGKKVKRDTNTGMKPGDHMEAQEDTLIATNSLPGSRKRVNDNNGEAQRHLGEQGGSVDSTDSITTQPHHPNHAAILGDPSTLNLRYFYPVMPIEYLVSSKDRGYTREGVDPVFVMQGNFGGKHAHRKDPKGTVQCLADIESDWAKEKRDHSGHSRILLSTNINDTYNRNAKKLRTKHDFAEIEEARLWELHSESMTKANYSSKETEPSTSTPSNIISSLSPTSSPVPSTRGSIPHKSLSIDLIGHLNGEVKVGKLSTGRVRFLSFLSSKEYYTAISRGKFMVAAVGEQEYYNTRATSSVPAALITHIPLVTNKNFLQIYPCLRDATIHKLMAQGTECDSIKAAVSLSDEQYRIAKEEISTCSNILFEQAKDMFLELFENAKKKSRGSPKSSRVTGHSRFHL